MCFYMKHLVLSLVLSKPTKSSNFYCYYSANDTKAGDTGIKEQKLSGWSDSEVGLRTGRGLAIERG